MQFDVFNGDADGIFALHQLRLDRPISDAILVTGVKRDINLLKKIQTDSPSAVTVLDISLDKNRKELQQFLSAGWRVVYIDHHFAGSIPESDLLDHHIEPSAETCTSIIVNQLLQGRYPLWASCGAFGDNLHEQAVKLAKEAGADDSQIAKLRETGELFNYNGYGAQLEDLHFHPADLFNSVSSYVNPLDFFEDTDIIPRLREGYLGDMDKTAGFKDISAKAPNRIFSFPAESWARRIAGVFSNLKARERKEAAHAIIVENNDGTLQVSVRAPLADKKNADVLCRRFPTGGGRAAAAGINNLPSTMLDEFTEAFHTTYTNNS